MHASEANCRDDISINGFWWDGRGARERETETPWRLGKGYPKAKHQREGGQAQNPRNFIS